MNARMFRSPLFGSVGVVLTLASGSVYAVTYRLTELTLGGTFGEASGINASGQVTGWSSTADNTEGHAFLGTARRSRTSARWGAL